MGKIDLKKFQLHTDLIIDHEDTKQIQEYYDGVMISRSQDNGNYITISFDDITDYEKREYIGEILEGEIKKILKLNKIKDNDEVLIIGLGNRKSTPDSLGVKVIDNLLVTRHLFLGKEKLPGIRKVMALTPGVMSDTGMESAKIILSIVSEFKPKFIIAIDALASLSVERINKTIQLTDTGIHPGSGIGNNRMEISQKTIGIPVIAIGVPTVVSSQTIVYDTINSLYSYIEKIKKEKLTKEDKNNLLGLFGSLTNEEKKGLISEVLEVENNSLIVTPTEIDFLIDKLGNVIGNALNNSLHRQISHF